jgi:chromosome segregation ATPase
MTGNVRTKHFDRGQRNQADESASLAQARQEASFARRELEVAKAKLADARIKHGEAEAASVRRIAELALELEGQRARAGEIEARLAASERSRNVLVRENCDLAKALRQAEAEKAESLAKQSNLARKTDQLTCKLKQTERNKTEINKLHRRLRKSSELVEQLRTEVCRLKALVPPKPLVYAKDAVPGAAVEPNDERAG